MKVSIETLRQDLSRWRSDITIKALKALDCASTNTLYKLETTQGVFLLKFFALHHVLPIDRRRQFALQKHICSLGLAPEPLYLSDTQAFYIEQWCNLDAPNRDLDALACRLAEIHQCQGKGFEMDICRHWQHYSQQFTQSAHDKLTFDKMCQAWQAFQDSHNHEAVLCHNDLHYSHIAKHSKIILDWEYAGHHCRFFDLASCSLINQMNRDEFTHFIHSYAQYSAQDPAKLLRLSAQASQFVEYTYSLWQRVAAERNG